MIYVPNLNYKCYVIQDSNTIRAYASTPSLNSTVSYVDFFINSHYMERPGVQQFGNYNVNVQCLDKNNLTDAFMYRNDIADILLVFVLLLIILILPFKMLLKRLFRGLLR